MNENTETLDRLVGLLDRLSTGRTPPHGDAIDAVLEAPPRRTQVVSLRDSAVVQTFRNELIDGLIRIDTANQLLRLVTTVLERLPL